MQIKHPMSCDDAPEMLKLRRQFAANNKISDAVKLSLMDCIDLMVNNHKDLKDDCDCFEKAQRDAGITVANKPELVA